MIVAAQPALSQEQTNNLPSPTISEELILDPAVRREQFDGVFRADDPESFARAVAVSLGVWVDLADASEIRIGDK